MGQTTDQTLALLKKNAILKRRSYIATICLCVCPGIGTFFGGLFGLIFWYYDIAEPETVPYNTREFSQTSVLNPTYYSFDPYPMDCAAVTPSDTGNAGPSWLREGQPEIAKWGEFDCFIDGMSVIVPMWRNLLMQLRQWPVWEPEPLTFASSPGIKDDLETTGGSFIAYTNKRYDDNMGLTINLFAAIDQDCFRVETLSNYTFPQCVTEKPMVCLTNCLNDPVFNGMISTLAYKQVSQNSGLSRALLSEVSKEEFASAGKGADAMNSRQLSSWKGENFPKEKSLFWKVKGENTFKINPAVTTHYENKVQERDVARGKEAERIQRRLRGIRVRSSSLLSRVFGAKKVHRHRILNEVEQQMESERALAAADRNAFLKMLENGGIGHHVNEKMKEYWNEVFNKPKMYTRKLKVQPMKDMVRTGSSELDENPFDNLDGNLRNLQGVANCQDFDTACDCVAHRDDNCAWRTRTGRTCTEGGECGRCRRQSPSRPSVTSCYECIEQTECDEVLLWERLARALPSLKPSTKVYSSEDLLMEEIGKGTYPKRSESVTTYEDQLGNQTTITRQASEQLCGAVVFLDVPEDIKEARKRKEIDFSLRLNATSTLGNTYGFNLDYVTANRPNPGYMTTYASSGFLGLQTVVNDWLHCEDEDNFCFNGEHFKIESERNLDAKKVTFGSMGIPENFRNFALSASYDQLADNIWLAFCVPVLAVAGRVLREKESKIKDGMRMMGLRDSAFYLADFLINGITTFITAIVVVVVFCNMPYLNTFTNPFILFVVFFFNLFSLFQFGMCLTMLFNSGTFGKICIFGICYISSLIHLASASESNSDWKRFWAIFPSCSLRDMLKIYIEMELLGDGAQFWNMWIPINSISMGSVIVMEFFSIFWWSGVFIYFDQIVPSEFGVPRKWYFCFQPSFWIQDVLGRESADSSKKSAGSGGREDLDEELEDLKNAPESVSRYFEERSAEQQAMINRNETVCVRRLRKEFNVDGAKLVAVNDINFTMYKDEIFVLLGHNGAGKTTAISMLTGLITRSGGTCEYYGNSMQEQLAVNRDKVGICPQHSVLWPNLTCMEHLLLFARFKSVDMKTAKIQAMELLREQAMESKANDLAGNLSGGMKRKLSLAIAFMGDPSIVFLDEPSSGMDTTARREVWDLLRTRKEGRTIILTTHYMDEADILGDRIAIMAHGVVKCCGNSNFLKKQYGCGYNLSFVLEGRTKDLGPALSDWIIKDLFKDVPVKLMSMAGSEMLFLAPFEASQYFKTAFNEVEARKKEFMIHSWNLQVCNLEEVFLKVANSDDADRAPDQHGTAGKPTGAKTGDETPGNHVAPSESNDKVVAASQLQPTTIRQFKSMFVKRWVIAKRGKGVTWCQLLCPACMVAMWLSFALLQLRDRDGVWMTFDANYNPRQEEGERAYIPYYYRTKEKYYEDSMESTFLDYEVHEELSGPDLDAGKSFKPWDQSCMWENCTYFKFDWGGWGGMGGSKFGGCPRSNATAVTMGFGYRFPVLLANLMPTNYWGGGGRMEPPEEATPYPSNQTDEFRSNNTVMLQKYSWWLEEEVVDRDLDKVVYGSYIFAEEKNVNIQINNTGIHALPIHLQELYESVSRSAGNKGKSKVKMHTLPLTNSQREQQLNFQTFSIAINVNLAFAFVSSFGLMFIVMEKEGEIKLHQFINGCGILVYWISNLIWDAFMYLIPVVSVVLVLSVFKVDILVGEKSLKPFLILLGLFSLCMPSFGYICAHYYKDADQALSASIILNIIVALALFLTATLMELLPFEDSREIIYWAAPFLRLWPVYSLGEGLRRICIVSFGWQRNPPEELPEEYFETCREELKEFKRAPHECCQDLFDEYGAGYAIYYMLVEVFVYFFITVMVDFLQQNVGFRQMIEGTKAERAYDDPINGRHLRDQAVRDEESRVAKMSLEDASNTGVFIKNGNKTYVVDAIEDDGENGEGLKKRKDPLLAKCLGCGCCVCRCPCLMPSRNVNAVRDVSLALAKGEVLGLLGANGAGKTTLFRMMCGVEVADRNPNTEIMIGGKSIFTQRAACRKLIGYTAQANPIWSALTVEEHLRFYAGVKGVDPKDMHEVVEQAIHDMDLTLHRAKRAGNLSGGNKRKLVIAMSLIAVPTVLFLDEPSAGMDPEARRNMWSIIQNIATKSKHSTVILTTHSMDECEALCSKVVIMTNGVHRCNGSIPRIKDIYGQGYDLFFKLHLPHRVALEKQMGAWGKTAAKAEANQESARRGSLAADADGFTIMAREMIGFEEAVELIKMGQTNEGIIKTLSGLIQSRTSPFALIARASTKDRSTLNPEEIREIGNDRCRLGLLTEWFILTMSRLSITTWVHSNFADASLLEQQGNTLTYHISDADTSGFYKSGRIPLGNLFGMIEEAKGDFNVEEYAITPTTLEAIFNNFNRTDRQDGGNLKSAEVDNADEVLARQLSGSRQVSRDHPGAPGQERMQGGKEGDTDEEVAV